MPHVMLPRLGLRRGAVWRCRFALSGVAAFKACLRREWTLMTRHSFIYIFRTCQVHALLQLQLYAHSLAAARWYHVSGYFPQGSGVGRGLDGNFLGAKPVLHSTGRMVVTRILNRCAGRRCYCERVLPNIAWQGAQKCRSKPALRSGLSRRVAPAQVCVVSTVIATLFLRSTLHTSSTQDGQTYLGLLFFAIIHMVRANLTPLNPKT